MKGIDVVIHLAARAHVMDDQSSNPLAEYRRINVDGTKAVAEAARDAGVKRLVFLSSIKVNGEQTFDKPYTASDTPAPEDAYGISKAEAEKMLTEISTRTGLEIVIIRTPLVYGPGVRANFLSLMSLANGGLPLPFGALTKNRRSLIYIGNLVDILLTATRHPAAGGQTFLVRDGTDLSTAKLVRLLRSAIGRSARMLSVPPAVLYGLLTLLGKKSMSDRLLGSLAINDQETLDILDWSPPFSVEDGLKQTVDWYRAMKMKG
jgi:nucleoside-diphosphate-sugar epimerase